MLQATTPDSALLLFFLQLQRRDVKLAEIFPVRLAHCHLEGSMLVFIAVKLRPKATNAKKHACIFMLKERRAVFHEELHRESSSFLSKLSTFAFFNSSGP